MQWNMRTSLRQISTSKKTGSSKNPPGMIFLALQILLLKTISKREWQTQYWEARGASHSLSLSHSFGFKCFQRRCVILFSFYISGWMELLLVLGPCAHSHIAGRCWIFTWPPHCAPIDQFVYTHIILRERDTRFTHWHPAHWENWFEYVRACSQVSPVRRGGWVTIKIWRPLAPPPCAY